MVQAGDQSAKQGIDVHMHLAGTGCCHSGCWMSPSFRRRHTFQALRLLHGISNRTLATTADRDWADRLARTVRQSTVEQGVALGFDGVYDPTGGRFDTGRSQLIVPPSWVFQICRERPELLPGPSINPYREDALTLLAYCIDQGAVLIKWLPAAQGIDPLDARIADFYRLLAASGIPLLIHMGGERTFRTVTDEFNHVSRLKRPLDAGIKVICAHTATRVLGTGEPDQTADLKALLTAYPNLYVDNSGLCNPSRFSHLPGLARDEQITGRTLYGSDFPVPSHAIYYLPELGWRQTYRLGRIANPLDRDIAIKRRFGYPDATLTRARQVLANLERWPLART